LSKKYSYYTDNNFDHFLNALHQQEQRAWHWLIEQFRQKLIPFLRKRTQSYPSNALLSRDQFLEEVIEETLLQFYQIFQKGSFQSYSDLEATVVTTAGYKLKEGFARLRKEQKMHFMEADKLGVLRQKLEGNNEHQEAEKAANIALIQSEMQQLKPDEKNLLVRYFNGEELQDIAIDFDISPAAARKRKQRIVEKLKGFVLKALTSFLVFFKILDC